MPSIVYHDENAEELEPTEEFLMLQVLKYAQFRRVGWEVDECGASWNSDEVSADVRSDGEGFTLEFTDAYGEDIRSEFHNLSAEDVIALVNTVRVIVQNYEENRKYIESEVSYSHAVAVEPREGYTLWVKCANGVEGILDVSDMVGWGVWRALEDRAFFESAHIQEEFDFDEGYVCWGFGPCGSDTHNFFVLDDAKKTYAELLGVPPLYICSMTIEFNDLLREAKRVNGIL